MNQKTCTFTVNSVKFAGLILVSRRAPRKQTRTLDRLGKLKGKEAGGLG